MKVGIAGFSGSGKSTVFQWLSGVAPDPSKAQHGQLGSATVADERLDWLSAHFEPEKTTPARIDLLDTPGLLTGERRDNPRRLGIMRDANGLLVVLSGHMNDKLADELRRFREEILLADLEITSGRITRLEEQLRKPRPGKQKELDQHELDLLKRVAGEMEQGRPAAALGLSTDEEKMVRSFQLLTLKPEFVIVNCAEDRIGQPLPDDLRQLAPTAMQAPAKLELELEDLSDEDRQAFMQDLNMTGCARDAIIRDLFYAMGVIVFFTVGEDECRAWPVAKGASAVEAAGEIHTDLSRGFVRGEVVSWPDFRRVGSLKDAKQQGVYRLEGKTYVIQDGDIMHVLAST